METPFLFVALDGLSEKEEETLKIVERLCSVDGPFGFKINLDYLLLKGIGPALQAIQGFGRPVFTDLKMWNGKRTMKAIIAELVMKEVDYFNVYALADSELIGLAELMTNSKTKALAVTVLTHYTDDYCRLNFGKSLSETVRYLSFVAFARGCHGLILPGTVLDSVRDLQAIKAVPGVRPSWFKDTRHGQEVEPRVAVDRGAGILVCGSPIMKWLDPVEALQKVLSEMRV